jgi:hypothetical protein
MPLAMDNESSSHVSGGRQHTIAAAVLWANFRTSGVVPVNSLVRGLGWVLRVSTGLHWKDLLRDKPLASERMLSMHHSTNGEST